MSHHFVADEDVKSIKGRRNEVYKSQVTLMSLKDINQKQNIQSESQNET